jgi:aspartate/methionine/tyrosine aminotransferase
MSNIFADRMKALETETGFEVMAKARLLEKQGKEIVHLEIGEPDFDTPRNIKEAAMKALDDGYTHYTPSSGLPEVKQVIAEHVSKTRKLDVKPEEVVITPGAKPVMFFSLLALVSPGDEVMYPNPGFPAYEALIKFVDAKPVPIPLKEENGFSFEPEYVKKKITKKTKMIILNSPENPTGGIIPREDLKVIADCLENRDEVFVLSDEIYSKIVYEGKPESISQFPGMKEKTIILDGFSKTYAMTGWRLGYGVMRKDLAGKMAQLMTNSNSCTNAFVQLAGVEALKGPQTEVEKMVAEFRKRREVIVDGLNEIKGITCMKPHGAFYAFPNITGTAMNSRELGDHLLQNAGVAVLPGISFGEYGEGYLRLSFANSIENIKKALDRIEKSLKKL